MIYDRPISELMADAAATGTPPFTVTWIVSWFNEHYPRIKRNSIVAHIRGLTANDPNRHHHPHLAAKPPLFFRTSMGTLDRFDPDLHIGHEDESEADDGDGAVIDDSAPSEEAAEFVLESQLEAFLVGNWNLIDWGRPLKVWTSAGGESGHQLTTPVGRLDFLCVDTGMNALVVVELKRGRPSDKVVGQIARYMGWVTSHVANPGQAVEGLIVAHESDEALRYAVSAIPGLRLMTYEVRFELTSVAGPLSGQPAPSAPAAVVGA